MSAKLNFSTSTQKYGVLVQTNELFWLTKTKLWSFFKAKFQKKRTFFRGRVRRLSEAKMVDFGTPKKSPKSTILARSNFLVQNGRPAGRGRSDFTSIDVRIFLLIPNPLSIFDIF